MESSERFDMEKARKLIESELVRLIDQVKTFAITGKQKDLVPNHVVADAFDVLMGIYRTLGSITRNETALDPHKRRTLAHAFRALEKYTFIDRAIIMQGDAFVAEHDTRRRMA